MRTTVNIDAPILDEIKTLAEKRNQSLGSLISQLLGRALKEEGDPAATSHAIGWTVHDTGGAMVDLEDKDAVYAILDCPKTS